MPSITILDGGEPAALAAAELERLLARLDQGRRAVPGDGALLLGTFEACGVADGPPTADPVLDDAIVVRVAGGRGVIAGSNPRSILLAAYRFLQELGCRWIRPGVEGECIPSCVDWRGTAVEVREAASVRHRGVCIEGAVSLSNVLDCLEWLPRVGMNAFFMQFRDGYIFFDRWYSREENPRRRRPQPIERSMAEEFTVIAERELRRRGLLHHAVGHGWHVEAYGIPGKGWLDTGPVPEEFARVAALVNGERPVPWNLPMLTALCWSDPAVVERISACVCDYAAAHPAVDYLHVWLDDWMNNKCECERCREGRPADGYVRLLNRIDADLSARRLPARIVFLAYCDLLWPPVSERLSNPGRFTFMYANSRADYRKSLAPAAQATMKGAEPLPEFHLNALPTQAREGLPTVQDPASIAAFRRAWVPHFHGDSFIYEYYFDGASDLASAEALAQDIRGALGPLQLNGWVNCQTQRCWFPTGVGMAVLSSLLWDGTRDYAEVARDHAEAAYGAEGGRALEWVRRTQDLVAELKALPAGRPAEAVAALRALREEFLPVVALRLAESRAAVDPVRALSWRLLEVYAACLRRVADHAEARGQCREQARHIAYHGLQEILRGVEDELQPYFQPSTMLAAWLPK